MRNRICLSAIMVVAVLGGLSGQEPPPGATAAAPTQSSSAPPYRMLQLVSAGNTEQQINDAASAGYRFLMLQPTAGASGITVLMKKMEAGATPYLYRLAVAEPGKERLQRALNQAGDAGFRLVTDSLLFALSKPRGGELLLWPLAKADKEHEVQTYIAVMEKAPGATATYEYRVSSAMRLSSAQKDLREITGQGFSPLGSTEPHFVLVFEKEHRDAHPVRPHGQYAYVKICEFLSPRYLLTELTSDVPAEAAPLGSPTEAEKDPDVGPTEDKDTGQGAEGAASEYAPPKPRLQTATIAGARVLFLDHFLHSASLWAAHSDSVWVLAEKQPETPPPLYRLVLRADSTRLEEALNSSAQEGFRLFNAGVVDTARSFVRGRGEVPDINPSLLPLGIFAPHRVKAGDTKRRGQVLAVLQRDAPTNRYQYRIFHADDAVDLLKQMNEAAAQGYSFTYMWGTNVLMEKAVIDSAAKGDGL